MAAEIELKKINEYVQECLAITSITGSYVYGIDSNGNSIKIAVETLASAGTDYSQQIAALTTKCNNNTTLITALQSAVNGKANAVHTHQQSDISGLSDALAGKAAASHTHAQSDITGLTTALNGKAAASHTHGMSAIVGLTDALNSKANSVHTHAIGDVANLQPALANHEQRITDLEGQGGGTVGNFLKQVDLNTYSGGSDGEIVRHIGETTADYTNGYTYKCEAGEVEKTIPSGSQCIRLTQSGEEYISDGEADTTTTRMVMVLQPTAEGVTYNVFAAQTIAETDIEKLVGCYVPDEIGAIHQITAITHNGTSLTSVTLDNGVTLEITSSTPSKSTLAWYEFYSKSGAVYYGGSGSTGYMIASKTLVSSPSGAQSYTIATEPIGTAFGGTIQNFTASEDIVIRSVEWTQSPTQPETSVASGDYFLSQTDGAIGSTISIGYNSTNQHLELKGNNDAVVAYVDMSQFIVDGMLDDVQLYTTAEQGVTVEVPYLKFTFNVASGKSIIRVSLKDLVDIYDGSNVDLTSAFVKAATYSAPAIGDSMDVAIGKLLKGHEDNAAAISGKQDTLTFDDAPQSGSNRPVTSQGIKAAIDSAIGGVPNALKQVDLTTYQGTDGEIVQHTGATTAKYVNGWNYKFTQGGTLPSDEFCVKLQGAITQYQQDVDIAALIGDDRIFLDSDEHITFYNDAYASLYIGSKTAPAIGDSILGDNSNDAIWEVEEVVSDVQPFKVRYRNGVLMTQSFITTHNLWLKNSHGVKLYCLHGYNEEDLKAYPQTVNYAWFVGYGDKMYKITLADGAWLGSTDDVDNGGWQQWDSQPSSVADVSALQQRMTAAETAISGKQATITGAASTITTANLTASKVLGSDANGKVAATSIATADAEDAVAKRHTQNTDTRILSPNQGNSVTCTNAGTVINGITSISGSLSVSGNLNVTGKETVEEIVNIKSENNFITLRDGAQTAIASGSLSGTKVENYDGLGNDLLFGTDASGVFRIGDDGGTLEPIATRDEAANLTDGQLMKWDATNQRMVGINDIRANTVNGAPLSNAASYFYGVSTSAANATQKEVSIPSITTLNAGQMIVVSPTINSDIIQNATLKLNNFAAYPISYVNFNQVTVNIWNVAFPSVFVFTGSVWRFVCRGFYDTAMTIEEGIAGIAGGQRTVSPNVLQQIIHAQIDKFVGTRAMTEDAYWDLVTAGTVQADTLYITYDKDYSED